MNNLKDNGYLILARLSNIELYYSSEEHISDETISLAGDEFNHAVKVMRSKIGDIIYITNGIGSIFKTEISFIENDKLSVKIIETIKTEGTCHKPICDDNCSYPNCYESGESILKVNSHNEITIHAINQKLADIFTCHRS